MYSYTVSWIINLLLGLNMSLTVEIHQWCEAINCHESNSLNSKMPWYTVRIRMKNSQSTICLLLQLLLVINSFSRLNICKINFVFFIPVCVVFSPSLLGFQKNSEVKHEIYFKRPNDQSFQNPEKGLFAHRYINCTFSIYGALGKMAFCQILKRLFISWITGCIFLPHNWVSGILKPNNHVHTHNHGVILRRPQKSLWICRPSFSEHVHSFEVLKVL